VVAEATNDSAGKEALTPIMMFDTMIMSGSTGNPPYADAPLRGIFCLRTRFLHPQ